MRGSTATRHAISRARFARRSARREAKSARTRRSRRTPTRRMGAPEADASATADSSTSARPFARSLTRAGSMSKRRAQRSRVARGVGGWSGTKRWYSWRPWRMRRGERAEGSAGSSETSLRSCSPHEGHGSLGWEGRGVRREGRYRGSQRGAVGLGCQTACDSETVTVFDAERFAPRRARARLLAAVVGDALLVETHTATPRGERPTRPEGRLAHQTPRLTPRHGSERGVSLLPLSRKTRNLDDNRCCVRALGTRGGSAAFRRKYRTGGRKLRHVARPTDAHRVASRRDIAARASARPRRIASRPRLRTR